MVYPNNRKLAIFWFCQLSFELFSFLPSSTCPPHPLPPTPLPPPHTSPPPPSPPPPTPLLEKLSYCNYFLFKILQMDVRNRQEEISYLRASMSRLREDLDQQRRLNVCLKERKVSFRSQNWRKNNWATPLLTMFAKKGGPMVKYISYDTVIINYVARPYSLHHSLNGYWTKT